jgi:hypothetical protein
MQPGDAKSSEQGRSDRPNEDDLVSAKQELLARAREVAQQITERVAKALAETDGHPALPTEENPPLS